MTDRIRVGFVGLRPAHGWATRAHLPALSRIGGRFVPTGVVNSTLANAQAAAAAHGIAHAFASAAEMAASPEIDLIVVTTRVPQHFEIVKSVLEAGKPVYCEWPVSRTLDEAVELDALATQMGVPTFTGNQSRTAPAIRQAAALVREGGIGEIVSTRIEGYVLSWGPVMTDRAAEEYLRRRSNGASLLTIPLGHALAALRDVLGDISALSAVLETRYPRVAVTGSHDTAEADAADHILIAGMMTSGAPLSITYAGGTAPTGPGFLWDIRGTAGDLRISGETGYMQVAHVEIAIRRGTETEMVALPVEEDAFSSLGPVAGNVARLYDRIAQDLGGGTRSAPGFDDAVELHRVIEAIERSAETGRRVTVDAPNRLLP